MSRNMQLPSTVKLLTNVAIVRYTKGGERFELACYPSKVLDYRTGIEKDVSEVLQSDQIFVNVTLGKLASKQSLDKRFGAGVERSAIIREMLEKGVLQVSEAEREAISEKGVKSVLDMLATKCINPNTHRSYTPTALRQLLDEHKLHVNLPHDSGQSVALDAKTLKPVFLNCLAQLVDAGVPIVRMPLKVRVSFPAVEEASLLESLASLSVSGGGIGLLPPSPSGAPPVPAPSGAAPPPPSRELLVTPSLFRAVEDLAKTLGVKVDVLELDVADEAVLSSVAPLRALAKAEKQGTRAPGGGELQEEEGEDAEDEDEGENVKRLVQPARNSASAGKAGALSAASDSDSDDGPPSAVTSKKSATKKSKKDKRRQAAAQAEQEEAAAKEAARVAARKARLELQQKQQQQQEGGALSSSSSSSAPASSSAASPSAALPFAPSAAASSSLPPPPSSSDGSSLRCNTCGGDFKTPGAHRSHFKSDWHIYNLKLKQSGGGTLTEAEFKMVADTLL